MDRREMGYKRMATRSWCLLGSKRRVGACRGLQDALTTLVAPLPALLNTGVLNPQHAAVHGDCVKTEGVATLLAEIITGDHDVAGEHYDLAGMEGACEYTGGYV